MTPRQSRLKRLVHLREQQHSHSVATLRIAQSSLERVETHVRVTSEERLRYRQQQDEVMDGVRHDLWLVSRAAMAICDQQMANAMNQRSAKQIEVCNAKQKESSARCAFLQMDTLLSQVRNEERETQESKEQTQMEETARFLMNYRIESVHALEVP